MKTTSKLLALALLAGGSMFAATRVSVGIGVGGFGPPPAYAAYRPVCPGPGYSWVDGYWTFNAGRRVWIDGFWRAPERVVVRHDFDRDRHFDRDDHGRDHGRDFRR